MPNVQMNNKSDKEFFGYASNFKFISLGVKTVYMPQTFDANL